MLKHDFSSLFSQFFQASVHQYDTKQASKGDIFMTQENTLQYGLRSARYAGAKPWNNTLINIKKSVTVAIFRQKFKLHLFSTRYQRYVMSFQN